MKEWVAQPPLKLWVTDPREQVAKALLASSEQHRTIDVVAADVSVEALQDLEQIKQQLDSLMPDYVVNTVGYNRVAVGLDQRELCYQLNRDFVELLAQACGELAIPLIHLSTDHVFDGHYASGYQEQDEVRPLGLFGDSKWQGEELLRQLLPRHVILRVSWIFSGYGENFLTKTLDQARDQAELEAVDDRHGCPTSAEDVARVILAMVLQLENGADNWGTYHYCGAEVTSRYGFCEAIIASARQFEQLAVNSINPVARQELHADVERPASSVLTCSKLLSDFGIRQLPWRSELTRTLKQYYLAAES